MPPVAAVTDHEIQIRIRDLALEEDFTRGEPTGDDFWDPEEVMDWYGEGCRRQLRVAMEAAKMGGAYRRLSHPFLAHYVEQISIDIVADRCAIVAP